MTIDTSPDALERLALVDILLAPHNETVLYVLSASRTLLAIAAEKRAQGWQPIETAPRNGILILLFGSRKQFHGTIHKHDYVTCGHYAGKSWVPNGDYHDEFIATHWMPLPKPPEVV